MDLNLKVECDSKDGYLYTWQEDNVLLISKDCKPVVNQGNDSNKKNYTKQNIHIQHPK